MATLLGIAVLVYAVGTYWAVTVLLEGLDKVATALRGGFPEEADGRLFQLEQLVDVLPQKWEEMVKQAKRSEDRARAVVKRAQDQLAEAGYEHPGIEAEASELRRIHGDDSDPEQLQLVPERMDRLPEGAPYDPDEAWERATKARKYGVT
jgi:hypothetical protein